MKLARTALISGFLFLSLSGCSHPAAKIEPTPSPPPLSFEGQSITAELVLASAEKNGAAETIHALWDKHWDPVIQGIESGDPQWIAVYMKLGASTDAGETEEFNQAIAGALETNPVAALAGLKAIGFAAGANCATTDEEFDDVSPAPKVHANILKHVQKRLAKVRSAKESDPETRGACLDQLNTARMSHSRKSGK
jgi:hypothetical protein